MRLNMRRVSSSVLVLIVVRLESNSHDPVRASTIDRWIRIYFNVRSVLNINTGVTRRSVGSRTFRTTLLDLQSLMVDYEYV